MARRATSSFMVPVALSGWLVCEMLAAEHLSARAGCCSEADPGEEEWRLSPPLPSGGVWGGA